MGEFDKRLKLFLVGYHFIESDDLSIRFCDDFQGRKLMLIALKTLKRVKNEPHGFFCSLSI